MLIPFQPTIVVNHHVPFEEMVRDHNAILKAYFSTHKLRHHSKRTLKFAQWYLSGWFNGYKVRDDEHPDGRQLFIWEAMHPTIGTEILQSYADGLGETDLLARTCAAYLGQLNRIFEHVCADPHIPSDSNPVPPLIRDKYNEICNPSLKCSYPLYTAANPSPDNLLLDDDLTEFLIWIGKYLPKARNPFTAGRTYTLIVIAAECGFRFCEMEGMDALNPMRDILAGRNALRTRFGKATNGSGPRTREAELTPLSLATLKHYEELIRPHFPKSTSNPALFLTERGARLGYQVANSGLRVIVRRARADGLVLPEDMGWHSFRRSFATQFIQRHPDQIWKLLRLMGQHNPISLIRYIRPSEATVNKALGRFLERLAMGRIA
ncbi:MAG: site-specific integrase [Terracidiphilus sp.]